MKSYRLHLGIASIFLLCLSTLVAQNKCDVRIQGDRYIHLTSYAGPQYLFDDWTTGSIEFESGDHIENVRLKLNCFQNCLISFNSVYNEMVAIDKSSVKAFDLIENVAMRHFDKISIDELIIKGDYYAEQLYHGNIKLYCIRSIKLKKIEQYVNKQGKLLGNEYSWNYQYFLWDKANKYSFIKLNRRALLKYLNDSDVPNAKILLKNHKINPNSEDLFIKSLSLLEDNGFELNL